MNWGKGLFWRVSQQYSVYIVKLLVQIVLARILDAEEFGFIGIVIVFTSIAEIIAISGLGVALVQKMNPEEEDYSTVLLASEGIALLLYVLLFLFAPLIANYYEMDELASVLRVYGVIVFFQSYLAVINAYVQKNFLFKKSFYGNLIAVVLAGVVSVFLAHKGFGVWALVIYGFLYSCLAVFILQIMLRWHPSLGFSTKRFRVLFSFSWKVLVSSLIGSLLENIYNLSIGKYYGKETLGYYKQGNTYPDSILGQTRTAFGVVMLPVYSSLQNNIEELRKSVLRMTHLITAVLFPMAFGLAAIANTFVVVILTEKWLPSVFFLRLECVFYGTLPIVVSLSNGMISVGRSDVSAKLELSKLILTVVLVLVLSNHGVRVICIVRVLIAVAFILITALFARRILGLLLFDVFCCVIKPLLFSSIMGLIVYLVSLLSFNPIAVLFLELLVGIIVYGTLSFLFMKEDVKYLINLVLKKQRP